MSDLQVSLLIIGAIVVGAVTVFNGIQQWRLRRKLEKAFEDKPDDVLLGAASDPGERVEPQLGSAPGAPAADGWPAMPEPGVEGAASGPQAQGAALPCVPGFDPNIDYIVALDAAEPISAAGLADLHTRAAACGRRFRVVGFSAASGEWEEAARLSGGRYAHLRLALQLVSRKGSVDLGALTAFCAAAQECGARYSAACSFPAIERALAAARQIDAVCAEVDVAIGVNVVARAGKFSGTRVRTLAEAAGFKLEPEGIFHYRDEARQTLFTLDNHEPAPFLPKQVKHLTTSGVTLLLDVPRVAQGNATLDLMLRVGGELAQGLGGTLVDDNRVVLNEQAIGAIRQQLQSIHATMEARGMPPGSERALRLFS